MKCGNRAEHTIRYALLGVMPRLSCLLCVPMRDAAGGDAANTVRCVVSRRQFRSRANDEKIALQREQHER